MQTIKKHTNIVHKSVSYNHIPAKKELTVALVDDFTNKSISLGNGFTETHGHIGERFLEEGLPKGSKVDCFNTNITDDETYSLDQINTALGNVLKKMKHGKKYNALDMPTANYVLFKPLSEEIGIEITPQNISQHKDELKRWLFQTYTDEFWVKRKEIIEKLDKISARGVAIYIPAGNKGNESLNMFSLANKARTVGALNKERQKAWFSADNSLITNWELGIFKVRTECNSKGKCGLDYTEDGSVDTYFAPSPNNVTIDLDDYIMGTSFSTSRAIPKDLNSIMHKNKNKLH